MPDVEIFANIPDPPMAITTTADLDPALFRFRVPFIGGSNGDSLLNRGFHVWPDLTILRIGGVDYLYPETVLTILWFSVKETLPSGEVIFRALTDDNDVVEREDPQIAANPQASRLYMNFFPNVQTIYRDFPMDASKEYYLEVLAARVTFPGYHTFSGKFVVIPVDNANAGGSVDVRTGPLGINFVEVAGLPDGQTPGGSGQVLAAAGANATLIGGSGDDTVGGVSGSNYLRGSEGADSIVGGTGFDDAHGNQGDDTVDGGLGADWVVGGQGNDRLLAGSDSEFNIVYGNLGNDTGIGSAGGDWLRGGQGNDSMSGGAGADLLWGDRDADTLAGGAGADTFNIFGEAGLDRVIDFNRAEGDRVRVEPGYTHTVAQVGADVVISVSGGAQMVLVGVQLSSLTGAWIVSG